MSWSFPPHALRGGNPRRLALWLVLFALVAQQLGVVAHGAMLLRHALAGPVGSDFCTASTPGERGGLPASPAAPVSRHLADAACGACTIATAGALPPAFDVPLALAEAGVTSPVVQPQRPVPAEPRTAHRSRAPPVIA